ncbi:MAG: glycosyltransferase [Deferrisomatales bacterium]
MGPEARRWALVLSGLSGGGAQRRTLLLARGFLERGYRVDLVTPRPEGPFRAQVPPGARIVALGSPLGRLPGVASRRGLWVAAATPALARYLRRERPEAVLSTSAPANLSALWARRWSGAPVPVVATVNVHLSASTGERQRAWGPWVRRLLCRAYPKADALVAISRGVAEDLRRRTGVPACRVVTVYNPVDVDEVVRRAAEPVDHPWLRPGAPPLVVSAGKLRLQKDFPTLLRGFARLRARRPARLVILGEGEERGRLERLAGELGVARDVLLPGFVENPFAWMARGAAFALSSAWEGLSNVLLEALACGCTVVSTDCPSGPAEVLAGGRYGALVPVGDAQALAEALLHALDAPADPEAQRARARRFSVGAAVEAYLEVLETVAGSGRRTPACGRHRSG